MTSVLDINEPEGKVSLTGCLSGLLDVTSLTPFFFSSVFEKMITMVARSFAPGCTGAEKSHGRPSLCKGRMQMMHLGEADQQFVTSHLKRAVLTKPVSGNTADTCVHQNRRFKRKEH